MERIVQISGRSVGANHPCLVVAEIGQNHNGDLDRAFAMIHDAQAAGADLVKFQKRTPALCVPLAQQERIRETPWGAMTYLAYRERLEFDTEEFTKIDSHCRDLGIPWFASPWDLPSLEFLLAFDPPCLKVASACLTDLELLEAMRRSGKPIIASTGMSTIGQIRRAVEALGPDRLVLLHCTSTYPCAKEELNLRAVQSLRERYGVPVGYSGHHQGIWDGFAAAVLGACVVEKHFTLDRSAWGTDQAASLEPAGLARMVRYIRNWEAARGDGVKVVYDSERAVMARLRRVP